MKPGSYIALGWALYCEAVFQRAGITCAVTRLQIAASLSVKQVFVQLLRENA